jgi:hypothetical protein
VDFHFLLYHLLLHKKSPPATFYVAMRAGPALGGKKSQITTLLNAARLLRLTKKRLRNKPEVEQLK